MNKKPLIAATVLLALAVAAWAWQSQGKSASDGLIVLHGNVDQRQVALAFNGTERIATVLVQEGERVKAGQLLGELDTRSLQLKLAAAQAQAVVSEQALLKLQAGSRPEELAQADAAVGAAQAEADNNLLQAERLRSVHQDTAGRGVSQLEVDNATARAKVALARLQEARKARQLVATGPRKEDIAQAVAQRDAALANRALLAQNLADARLTAPIDAVVRARLLEPGDMASPQRPVLSLAIMRPKWVRAYVNERDLGRIRPDLAATVSIDSAPAEGIAGRIGAISSVAEFTPKTVQTEDLRTALVYEVRVLVDDPQDRLRLGMPATVRITPAQP